MRILHLSVEMVRVVRVVGVLRVVGLLMEVNCATGLLEMWSVAGCSSLVCKDSQDELNR